MFFLSGPGDPADVIHRTFSAGAVDGSSLAGEVAVRVATIGGQVRSYVSLAVIGRSSD
jgi:hypothetical protein